MKFSLRKAIAATCVVSVLAVTGGVAVADDIYNQLDGSIDATLESMTLTASGSSQAVNFYVQLQDKAVDGDNNCNMEAVGDELVVRVQSSDATKVSVAATTPYDAANPDRLRFADCDDTPSVTVTPVAVGSATITLSEVSNNTGGSFNLAPAAFTVTVSASCAAAPTTAPSVTETNAAAVTGWYSAASLPAAFTVSPAANAEYSLDNGATWNAYGTEVILAADGEYTVKARNFRPASAGCLRVDGPASGATTMRVDRTAPSLGLSVSPDANAAGWNKSTVTVDWTCADTGGSGVDAATCPADVNYGNGANELAASFTVSDVAGNTSSSVERRAIKVDTVAPALSVSVTPPANATGWNNSQVTADWTCTDNNSGFADPSPCPVDELFGQADSPIGERTVTVSDLAGNSATATRRSIKIDETVPSISVVVAPDANADGWNNSTVTADWTCSDGAGSGLASATPCPDDETLSAEGSYAARTETVDDNAGNQSNPATRRAVKIDKTAPTVTVSLLDDDGNVIAPNGNGWFNQNVRVDFTCSDPTSGGVSSGVATSGAYVCPADYTLEEGDHAASPYEVRDKADNPTTGNVPAIKIDTTNPVNAVTGAAQGDFFVIGNEPTLGCSTTDAGGSGVATSATLGVAGGNEFGVGEFTATCFGGSDNAGNAALAGTVTYTVGYGFLGFFQPINDPASPSPSVFKKGSTVPVKFALTTSTGARISDAAAQAIADACGARLFHKNLGVSTATLNEAESTNATAMAGNCFRYDAAADQFILNMGTRALSSATYDLIAEVSSGIAAEAAGGAHVAKHNVSVGLK